MSDSKDKDPPPQLACIACSKQFASWPVWIEYPVGERMACWSRTCPSCMLRYWNANGYLDRV